jgi:hypothetical protein
MLRIPEFLGHSGRSRRFVGERWRRRDHCVAGAMARIDLGCGLGCLRMLFAHSSILKLA